MPVQLTQQDIAELKAEGYTDVDIQKAVGEIERQGQGYAKPMQQASAFAYNPTDNLVKWQLELNDILERAHHLLREDIVEIKDGNISWQPHPHPKERVFNDYGVQEIMRVLAIYINRNTILSDYDPQEIDDIIFDFGKELNDFIFMKYEEFGMDELSKRKNYPMLFRQIKDMVHSTYKRALYGRERDTLREIRQVQQQEQIMPQGININTGEQRRERGVLNPLRYVLGKQK